MDFTISYPKSSYYDNQITRFCYRLTHTNLFYLLTTFVVISNTVILAIDRYPEPSDKENNYIRIANLTFAGYLTFESIIKFIGLGCNRFT